MYFISRVFAITPLFLWIIYRVYKKNKHSEYLLAALPVLINGVQSIDIIWGSGSYRASYLFGEMLVCVCGYIVTRPRFRLVIVSVALQTACVFATLQVTDITEDMKVEGSLYCLCACVVTIMAAYALEQISRRAFMLGLRVRLLNQELERMAMTDPMTGLGNRRRLEVATDRFWTEPSTTMRVASFILIDVDKFKLFNDTYGHSAGDTCLTRIGRVVADSLRTDIDLAVRFGGEEIIVFLPDTDFTEARQMAERIRVAIIAAAIPHPAVAEGAVVTASLGVATAPTTDCTCADLVRRADTALYAAKAAGRNQVWPPLATGHIEAWDQRQAPSHPESAVSRGR